MRSILILITIVLISFQGCKKYDEDEHISLLTAKTRLRGTWNDAEGDFTFEFKMRKKFTLDCHTSNDGKSYDGTWELSNSKEELYLSYETGKEETLIIAKLSDRELWFDIGWGHYKKYYK